MSVDVAPDSTFVSDLPPCTWRGWWLAWPKWLRIGVWTAGILVLLHILLAIRVAISLVETQEIRTMRQRGARLEFAGNWRLIRWHRHEYYLNLVIDGILGRGRRNEDVYTVELYNVELSDQGTDADLEFIGRHFPNLRRLWLPRSQITDDGLLHLRNCRHLAEISLSNTNLSNQAVETLAQFPCLSHLELNGTLIDDDAFAALQRCRNLRVLTVGYTDVTREGIQRFRQSAHAALYEVAGSVENTYGAMIGRLRWSDGVRGSEFCGWYQIVLQGPIQEGRSSDVFVSEGKGLYRRDMSWDVQHFEVGEPEFQGFSYRGTGTPIRNSTISLADGEYRVMVQLADLHWSEPVTFTTQDGVPSVSVFEFRMPVTRKQALETKP